MEPITHIKTKVCGLTRPEDLQAAASLGFDYAGMIFYEKSPRFAGEKLSSAEVKKCPGIQKVGVFVNAAAAYILKQVEHYGLDLIQLHGNEPAETCAALRKKVPVMKAFRIRTREDLHKVAAYEPVCDLFLFDSPGKFYGGNGTVFQWDLLQHYEGTTPFFLSGGIGLHEVPALKMFDHPKWIGIDVNSRFETGPGVKDKATLKQFLWDLNIS